MDRKFTFAKSDDDNIPNNAKNSDYWDEYKEEEKESIESDNFISNRDLLDEHCPPNEEI